MNEVLVAFLVTCFAGAATTLGGVISCYANPNSDKTLGISLSFSAGVIIFVSFTEILYKAYKLLSEVSPNAELYTFTTFFIGILLMAIIDFIIPQQTMGHTVKSSKKNSKVYRMGLFTTIVIAIHNFPEGMVTFFSTLDSFSVGISIAIAIFIHNIPEGIAIASPIYYSTKSKSKAIFHATLSGLAEPIGAIVGYLLFAKFINDFYLGVIFALVSGIMIYISFDELLPASRANTDHHMSIIGLFCGMFVMAISLILF